jgi:hypothetical protein
MDAGSGGISINDLRKNLRDLNIPVGIFIGFTIWFLVRYLLCLGGGLPYRAQAFEEDCH